MQKRKTLGVKRGGCRNQGGTGGMEVAAAPHENWLEFLVISHRNQKANGVIQSIPDAPILKLPLDAMDVNTANGLIEDYKMLIREQVAREASRDFLSSHLKRACSDAEYENFIIAIAESRGVLILDQDQQSRKFTLRIDGSRISPELLSLLEEDGAKPDDEYNLRYRRLLSLQVAPPTKPIDHRNAQNHRHRPDVKMP